MSTKKRKSVSASPSKSAKQLEQEESEDNPLKFKLNTDTKEGREGFIKSEEVRRGSVDLHFQDINERQVEDVSLEFLYRPHTLTLLFIVIGILFYSAFQSDDTDRAQNIWFGVRALIFVFLVVSILVFPNGPFTRPHPALWRLVFGMSVLYLMVLQFTLFQTFTDIRAVLRWYDPIRLHNDSLVEKEYAINCSQLSWSRVMESMDVYAVGHFLGWAMKAMLIRHTLLCWYISCCWEITELFFIHLLPNFEECWWDAILLDVLLCNGLGICFGLYVCQKLEMRTFHWESIKNIRGARGKIKRAVMQFTPASWTQVRWMDPHCPRRRYAAIFIFVFVWLITELNTFLLKHIFAIDTAHPIVIGRILLIGAISGPTIRQWYVYVTDPKCKRVGTQCWLYCAVVLTEAIICYKFGRQLFAQTKINFIIIWIIVVCIGSVGTVYLSTIWAKKTGATKQVKVNGEVQHRYIDSSYENLHHMSDSTPLSRRRRNVANPSESDF